MKYNGVTFVDTSVKRMTEREFIKAHIEVHWLDRDKDIRKKMLADVYKRITEKK